MNTAIEPQHVAIRRQSVIADVHRYEADPTKDPRWIVDAAAYYGLEDEDPEETYACFARRCGEAA